MGRLTKNPERRETQSGVAVTSFTLAVDRGYVKDSERQADFIDVVTWRNTADFVSKYFTKGQMAAVTGRLQIRDWTDKENNKRRTAEVIADRVYFTGKRESGNYTDSDAFQHNEQSDYVELDFEDGLPF